MSPVISGFEDTPLVWGNAKPTYFCPICGAAERQRERKAFGNSICRNDHVYPSAGAQLTTEAVKPVKRYPLPTEQGYYWAKWVHAAEGSQTKRPTETQDSTKNNTKLAGGWEAVDVWWCDGKLVVSVAGEGVSQDLEDFFWGPRCAGKPDDPKDLLAGMQLALAHAAQQFDTYALGHRAKAAAMDGKVVMHTAAVPNVPTDSRRDAIAKAVTNELWAARCREASGIEKRVLTTKG